MNVDKKVKELLRKPYKMDYRGCPNDKSIHSYMTNLFLEEWMLEQAIENSLIVVEEILSFLINDLNWSEDSNGNIHFWQEVKNKLKLMLDEFK